MTHNRTLGHALAAVAHPASAGAVLALLLNDHVLRRAWPGWWTGKLGDLAWLAFAPLLLAVPLSLALPRRDKLPLALSLGLVGGVFALANTVPAAHALALRALGGLLAAPAMLRLDPTDLLALPALAIAWWVWQTVNVRPQRPAPALPLLALGALATLANAPAPDYGIDCVVVQPDGTLLAASSWGWQEDAYLSADGGRTWEAAPPGSVDISGECAETVGDRAGAFTLADPANDAVVYRFTPRRSIERSADGGQTWAREIALRGSEARAAYLGRFGSGSQTVAPGPLAAALPPGGQPVAAMGHEGVLVRRGDGQWQWAAVGGYAHQPVSGVGRVARLLQFELWLALAAALLALGTLALTLGGRRWLLLVIAIPGWLAWGAALLTTPALSAGSYLGIVTVGLTAGAVLMGAAAALIGGRRLWRGRRALAAGASALAAGALFVLPFVLWASGALARYALAAAFAAGLVLLCAVGGVIALRAPAGHGAAAGDDRQPEAR